MSNSPNEFSRSAFIILAICLANILGCGSRSTPEVTFDADDAMKQIEAIQPAQQQDIELSDRLKKLSQLGEEVADSPTSQGRLKWLQLIQKLGTAMQGINGSVEAVESVYKKNLADWRPEESDTKLSGPGWIMTLTIQLEPDDGKAPTPDDVVKKVRENQLFKAVHLKEHKLTDAKLTIVIDCVLAEEA